MIFMLVFLVRREDRFKYSFDLVIGVATVGHDEEKPSPVIVSVFTDRRSKYGFDSSARKENTIISLRTFLSLLSIFYSLVFRPSSCCCSSDHIELFRDLLLYL